MSFFFAIYTENGSFLNICLPFTMDELNKIRIRGFRKQKSTSMQKKVQGKIPKMDMQAKTVKNIS